MAEVDDIINEPSEAEKRIKQLSDKVKLTSEERDEQSRLLKEQSDKTSAVEKERDFYQGFADIVSSNPSAKDHKEDILAKVKLGYTVEDATFAVLGKAGKLGASDTTATAGGSATTTITNEGTKSVSEMTRDEKLAALKEAESRGDLALT